MSRARDIADSASTINALDNVTASGAELNILDGVTSTTAELNILDGVTSTAAELNILDGVTSTASELNILDGVTSTATEINKLDALSRGSLIYGNASAETAILTKGSANQVLTSDGTDIAWANAAAGGAWTFISSVDMNSAATVNFTSMPVTTYDDFFIILSGWGVGSANQNFRARMFKAGSLVTGSNYYSGRHFNSATSSNSYNATFTTTIELMYVQSTNSHNTCRIWLTNMNDSDNTRNFNGWAEVNGADVVSGSSSDLKMQTTNFFCDSDGSSDAYDGIRFYPESGTFAGGTARLYGLAKS